MVTARGNNRICSRPDWKFYLHSSVTRTLWYYPLSKRAHYVLFVQCVPRTSVPAFLSLRRGPRRLGFWWPPSIWLIYHFPFYAIT
nr:hypothetical protein Iba_chr12cCG15450 [Ipomoea batatas]